MTFVGCGGRTAGFVYSQDGSVVDGAIQPDGSSLADGALLPDGGACVHEELWTTEYRGILSADPHDFDIPRQGQSFRLQVTPEPLSACQVPGPVFFETSEAQGIVSVALRAVVWTLHGADDCPPTPEDFPWIVTLPGELIDGQTLKVYALQQPAPLLEMQVEPCPQGADCFCAQTVPNPAGHLESCTYDCECAEGSCLPNSGWDPESRGCMRPCNDIEACREGEICISYLDGPSMLCEASPTMGCMDDQDCPFGYGCHSENGSSYCALQVVELEDWSCCVDQDCGDGYYCVGSEPNQGVCTIPCSTHEKCQAILPEMICHRTGLCLVPLDG